MGLEHLNPSPFGVNCHIAAELMLDGLADSGIQWYRFDLDWEHTQPERDRFDWTVSDRIVAWAARRRVALLAVLAYAPEWAWEPGQRKTSDSDRGQTPKTSHWVAFVEAAVRRYGADISAWSIWDEGSVPSSGGVSIAHPPRRVTR
jgi:polysaccharide biosynthesis protein PslG